MYNNSFRGASALGFLKGFESIGGHLNDVGITSELLDSTSLFLTGNADTVYYLSVIDLSKGPMVIEQPSDGVGTINDMWFSWIIDVGGPGPDRGLGGKSVSYTHLDVYKRQYQSCLLFADLPRTKPLRGNGADVRPRRCPLNQRKWRRAATRSECWPVARCTKRTFDRNLKPVPVCSPLRCYLSLSS